MSACAWDKATPARTIKGCEMITLLHHGIRFKPFPSILYPVNINWTHLPSNKHAPANGKKWGAVKTWAVSWLALNTEPPTSARRLYIYFWGGHCISLDIYIDRRPLRHCSECGRRVFP